MVSGIKIEILEIGNGIMQFDERQMRGCWITALEEVLILKTSQIEQIDTTLLQGLTDGPQRP